HPRGTVERAEAGDVLVARAEDVARRRNARKLDLERRQGAAYREQRKACQDPRDRGNRVPVLHSLHLSAARAGPVTRKVQRRQDRHLKAKPPRVCQFRLSAVLIPCAHAPRATSSSRLPEVGIARTEVICAAMSLPARSSPSG